MISTVWINNVLSTRPALNLWGNVPDLYAAQTRGNLPPTLIMILSMNTSKRTGNANNAFNLIISAIYDSKVTSNSRKSKAWFDRDCYIMKNEVRCSYNAVPLTYQPRICKDGFISIVTRSFVSLWNAVCMTGRWSIIGCCFGACQRSSCAKERRPQ